MLLLLLSPQTHWSVIGNCRNQPLAVARCTPHLNHRSRLCYELNITSKWREFIQAKYPPLVPSNHNTHKKQLLPSPLYTTLLAPRGLLISPLVFWGSWEFVDLLGEQRTVLVHPLERVHVCRQHPSHRVHWVGGTSPGVAGVEVLDYLAQVVGYLPKLRVEVLKGCQMSAS